MTPGRATVMSPRGTRAHASEELSLLCVTIPEFSCQAVLQVKYPEAIYLIVQGGVERCEYVSCIIEAVKHHEYVFLLHAVAAAAVASITSKASWVKGWGTRAAGGGAITHGVLKEEVVPRGSTSAIDCGDTIVVDGVVAEHGKVIVFWTSFEVRFKVVGKGGQENRCR